MHELSYVGSMALILRFRLYAITVIPFSSINSALVIASRFHPLRSRLRIRWSTVWHSTTATEADSSVVLLIHSQ